MAEKQTATKQQEVLEEGASLLDNLLEKVDMPSATDSQAGSPSSQLSSALHLLIHSITETGQKVEKVDKVLVDSAVAHIDKKISDQVNAILHHPDLQKLESAWRGLKHVVDNTNFRRNIKIEILNVSKDDLSADFEDAPEPIQSGLFKHVYNQEYDQYGGTPIGSIIGNYAFHNNLPDIDLLRNLSKISASTHAPFIGAIDPQFLGMKSIEELPTTPEIRAIFEKVDYAAWRSFRESEDSRYVGLTMPRFLLRSPYSQDGIKAKTFNFNEEAGGETHENYLWGNASYAFAANLTQSFAQHGWCVNIRGPQAGGLVEDMPVHYYEASGDTKIKIPTEVLISDRQEFELSEEGFIPLLYKKDHDYSCFFSANSSQKPQEYHDADATANSRLSARLPYLFLCSRIAHYLKVIQRENIGAAKEKEDLQKELNTWLETLITEHPNPGAKLKAERPLKEGQVIVSDIADNPGFYNVEMNIRPHFQIEGINVALSLVSRMPKEKS